MSPRSRVLGALAVVLALLAAVAIASTGDTPLGSGGARRPGDWFLDVVVSLVLVVMTLGTLAFAALILLGRNLLADRARLRQHRRQGLAVAAFCFVVLAAVVWWMGDREPNRGQAPAAIQPADGSAGGATADDPYDPRFALVPMLVLAALVVSAALAVLVSYRARRRHLSSGEDLALVLADVLEETLDDLRGASDPRRAVIAAYARLERVLDAYGLPRRRAEAPQEYVGRILGDLQIGAGAVERLTALFQQAKFSQHDVLAGMKTEAIDALEEVREDLRAEEARAAVERATAIAAARERAAG